MRVSAMAWMARFSARSPPRLSRCRTVRPLLAGIGRVESDQGQFGGAALQADGNESKPIVGPALDGAAAGMARIDDTDQGRYDGDKSYDRAVGPMQFLPGTWSAVGVDADRNGTADPQNIFDAAASAGVYLCAGGADLSTPAGQQAAVLRYNHSQSYVDLVLGLMRAYAAGESGTVLPDATHPIAPPNQITPPPVTTDEPDHQAQQAKHHSPGTTKTKTKTVTKKKTTTKRHTPGKKTPTKTTSPPVHVPPKLPIHNPGQPTPPPKAPSAPRGVHTDPVLAAAGPALELEWTAPKNIGSGIAGYRVNVTSATGKPVIDPLSAGKKATALTLPDLPDGGVYTVSITAWSARGKQQATGAPASVAVAAADPAEKVTGLQTSTDTGSTVAATWTWDPTATNAITPTGFVVRVVDADGTTAVEQQATADDRAATLTLPADADPTKVATVEVWATFKGTTGLSGVSEPVAADVKSGESTTPPPTATPSATPSSGPSSTPTPSSTPSASATPTK